MKTNRRIMFLILFIAGTGIFTLQAQNREERKELKEQTVKEKIESENYRIDINTAYPRRYYQMVKELRNDLSNVKVTKEFVDVDKRIAATSDYIKENILLSEKRLEESEEYGLFLNGVLDYNVDSENKEASTVLSGLAYYIIK